MARSISRDFMARKKRKPKRVKNTPKRLGNLTKNYALLTLALIITLKLPINVINLIKFSWSSHIWLGVRQFHGSCTTYEVSY